MMTTATLGRTVAVRDVPRRDLWPCSDCPGQFAINELYPWPNDLGGSSPLCLDCFHERVEAELAADDAVRCDGLGCGAVVSFANCVQVGEFVLCPACAESEARRAA